MRIGNAAVNQTQLDVYGEILDALYHAHLHGMPTIDRGSRSGAFSWTSGSDLGPARTRVSGRCAGRRSTSPILR